MCLPTWLLTTAFGGITSFGPLKLHPVLAGGQQVVVGGRQLGGFLVKLRNSGSVPVLVAERLASGELRARGRFAPRQRATLYFPAYSAAVVGGMAGRAAEFELRLSSREINGVSLHVETP